MPQKDLQDVLDNPPSGSTHYKNFRLESAAKEIAPEILHQTVYNSSASETVIGADAIIAKYKKAKSISEWGPHLFEGTSLLYKGLLVGGLAFAGATATISAPVALTAALVTLASDTLLSHTLDIVKTDAEKSTKKALAVHLHKYAKSHDLSSLEGKTPKEKLQIIGAHVEASDNPAFESAPDETKALINGTRIKLLADANQAMLEELSRQGEELEQQEVQLLDLENTVLKNEQALLDFQASTQEQFVAIDKSISSIEKGLKHISNRVDFNSRSIAKNREDINYMQGFLFEKMDPSEQIAALNNGFFEGMPDDDKKELEEKIALAEEKRKLYSNLSKFSNGAQELMSIAGNFGIELPAELSLAINVGSHAINAGLAFASGNYLGALSSVSKIFGLGGKKKDIGAARHRQVMKALGQLVQGQELIRKNQQHLLKWSQFLAKGQESIMENQRQMFTKLVDIEKKIDSVLENQQTIYKGVIELSKQLQKHHEKMLMSMEELKGHILVNRKHIQQLIFLNMRDTEDAFASLISHKGFLKKTNHFLSYKSFQDFAFNNRSYLKDGLPPLNNWIAGAGASEDTTFYLNGFESEQSVWPMVTHYKSLWEIFEKDLTEVELETGFASLINPVHSFQNLAEKLSFIQRTPRDQRLPQNLYERLHGNPDLQLTTVPDLLKELYSIDRTNQLSKYATRFHYMFFFFNRHPGDPLYSLKEISNLPNEDPKSQAGFRLLKQAQVRVQVALAQQTLLHGDILLEKLHTIFKTHPENILPLLNVNGVLAYNFVLYALNQEIQKRFIDYHIASHQINDPTPLNQLTQSKWNFTWDEQKKRYFIPFIERKIPLPDSKTLAEGKFIIPQEISELLSTQSQIVNELIGYTFSNSLSPDEKKIYMRSLLYLID